MSHPTSIKALAKIIDHTLLKADASEADLRKLCQEALEHKFFSVCVNSRWLDLVSKELKDSTTFPITVVGFPLGANLGASKAFEAEISIERGAREIDMVIDLGAVKSGAWKLVEKEIAAVVQASRPYAVKVILESCLLTDEEIRKACACVVQSGARFVKSSTGFSSGGATEHHVRLMRECVGPDFGVKASGGISKLENVKSFLKAGADRIGSSKSVSILQEAAAEGLP